MLQGQEHQEHCSGEQRCLPESSPLSLPERDTQAQGAVGTEVSHTTQLFRQVTSQTIFAYTHARTGVCPHWWVVVDVRDKNHHLLG